jgi:neutral ceramidase
MSGLEVGLAEVNITPPIGISLCGFGHRKNVAEAIHDDLFARALVLSHNGVRLAVVTADIISFAPDLVVRIRDLVSSATGIPQDHVLLNGSHSHSGPTVHAFRSMGERDAAYEDVLCRKVAGAVSMAVARLGPGALSQGRAPVRIAHNRRQVRDGKMMLGHNPGGPEAPWVDVLRIDRGQGDILGLLYATAAHPVNLRHLAFSAEFPGYAARCISRNLNGATALFAQGCCGDINCNPMTNDLETSVRLGEMLGAAALSATWSATPVDGAALGCAVRAIELPQILPSVEEAETALELQQETVEKFRQDPEATPYLIRQVEGQVGWAEDYLAAARKGSAPTQSFEIQAMRVGNVALVAYPGEMFVDYQLTMDSDSPFDRTFSLGYTNGCIGYVPTAEEYPKGGYEVNSAFHYYGTLMIGPECEERIKTSTLELLTQLSQAA